MTSFEDARAIAEERLRELGPAIKTQLALDESATRDEGWCWLFFYNSRAYLEGGSFSDALAGNGPIVVEKSGGRRHELTTARPFDEQLDELRRQLD